jgi:hypothetical protein
MRANRFGNEKDDDQHRCENQQRASEYYGDGKRKLKLSRAACNERNPMLPLKKTRDLARSLVASEAVTTTASLHSEPATVRVYERLRRHLGAPVGADGFHSLATRALALARSESPRLRAVQVMANGTLRGFSEVESQANPDQDDEVGIILIAQLLGLFLTLLGETTTLRLIEDLHLQAEVRARSVTVAAGTAGSMTVEPQIAAGFEDLLLEIDRLRNVCDRIEVLTDKHPDMGDGLLSAAENIRSIATVLDVFTLNRSKAGGSRGVAPPPKTNGYMN